jgi:uncharacterized protein YjbJ (UPF0337 family)
MTSEGDGMNRDIIEGNWKVLKGKVQVRWSRLFRDRLGVLAGRRLQAAGERQWAVGAFHATTMRKL